MFFDLKLTLLNEFEALVEALFAFAQAFLNSLKLFAVLPLLLFELLLLFENNLLRFKLTIFNRSSSFGFLLL